MKKYMQLVLCVFLLIGAGCADWINVKPENSVTFENYFKTEKDLQSLLYNVQCGVRSLPLLFADQTELVKDLSPNRVEEDEMPYMIYYWDSYYKVIDAANLIVDNIHRFPLSEDVTKPYLLQAYFALAVTYFQLATDYGEAVIIKKNGSYEKYGQSTVSEVLDEAEKWALKAIDLPKYEDLKIVNPVCKQYGSQGALQALLAKLYAWRAGVEGKKEYWEKAETCCTKIIDNKVGTYDLVETPEEVCMLALKGDSKEGIWELYQDEYELKVATFYGKLGFIEGGEGRMVSFPVVLASNPNTTSSFIVPKKTVREVYDTEDLRREAYFWRTDAEYIVIKYVDGTLIPDTEWEEKDSIVGVPYDNQAIERAYLYKYRNATYEKSSTSAVPVYTGLNMKVIRCRLADIILLRAECRAQQGKANAVEDLNRIRKRAYGGDSHAFPCADDVEKGMANDIQLAIFKEREKELFLEGHRYYDARRNGVDYVKRFCSHYSKLSDQDVEEGALYIGIPKSMTYNNDLLRLNIYWSKRL